MKKSLMEKRHFDFLAQWAHELPYMTTRALDPEQVREIREALAEDLARTNGNFNECRFLLAAGQVEV